MMMSGDYKRIVTVERLFKYSWDELLEAQTTDSD